MDFFFQDFSGQTIEEEDNKRAFGLRQSALNLTTRMKIATREHSKFGKPSN